MTQPFTTHTGRAQIIRTPDIDTDRIIPARFLTRTREQGFGDVLFADWRGFTRDTGCTVLVAGNNFGCGSSREHAVWALVDAGFRAVIAPQFADIFRANALKNGLLVIEPDAATCEALFAAAGSEQPQPVVGMDLRSQTLMVSGREPVPFGVDPFARHCLLEGIDELDFLMSHSIAIDAHERSQA